MSAKPPVFAFPVPPESIPFPSAFAQSGMTLRDYFAIRFAVAVDGRSHGSPADIANEAYLLADAMLAAREEARP